MITVDSARKEIASLITDQIGGELESNYGKLKVFIIKPCKRRDNFIIAFGDRFVTMDLLTSELQMSMDDFIPRILKPIVAALLQGRDG